MSEPIVSAPSARERLKSETMPEHVALEKKLDLTRQGMSLSDYAGVLRGFRRFYFAFDRFMGVRAQAGDAAARFYCDGRGKFALLGRDLEALGERDFTGGAPDLEELYPTTAHLWGAVYVVEGSTLGGTYLAKHFAGSLGLTPERGMSFFGCYGTRTGANWQETVRELEAALGSGEDVARACDGARATFNLISNCMEAHGGEQSIGH